MSFEKGEVREINYSQWLPFTELFRSFQIALDMRKLLLAALGIVFMYFGWWLLALVFGNFSKPEESKYLVESYGNSEEKRNNAYKRDYEKWELLHKATERYKLWPWEEPRGENNENPFQVVMDRPGRLADVNFYTKQVPVMLEPMMKFLEPIGLLLSKEGGFASSIFAILGILWTLAVWAVFGGAITRMAAVQVARKDKISMAEALKFSTGKFLSFFAAPLFPALGVAVICLIMIIIGGILLLIPVVGDVLTALLFFLPIIAGIVMAAMLLGYLGWPLMYATISAEGSDSFDALSRSYAYIFQRPWHYLFYSLVAMLYGVISILFVVFMTSFFVYMAKWGLGLIPWVGWRASGDPVRALFIYAPVSYGWRELLVGGAPFDTEIEGYQKFAAGIVSFWLHLIFLMMLGFAYSFFWSSFTIVYYLLRKKVDDTEMDEVYLEEEADLPFAPATGTEPSSAPPPGPTTLPMVSPTPSPAPPSPPAPAPTAMDPPKPSPEGNGEPTPPAN